MIEYDSSNWRTLLSLTGSVFPRACKMGVLAGMFSVILKMLHNEGFIDMNERRLITDSNGFSMFSATLAFVLVFRTSKCYVRFWSCAKGISTMRALMIEAASGLVVFTTMSKAPRHDIMIFRHKIVRLISLLHAVCLDVYTCGDVELHIIDTASFDQELIGLLKEAKTEKMRVDIVYTWISALIMRSLGSGLLNIPPPILSRVFQVFEKAMVQFHHVHQVITIPFPFPYAQMALALLLIFSVLTPIAMCYWTESAAAAGLLTFIAVLCFTSLEFIADELDNPFGEDANDLPCADFQEELNGSLALLVSPMVDSVPDLSEKSVMLLNGKVLKNLLPREG